MKRCIFLLVIIISCSTIIGQNKVDLYEKAYTKAKILAEKSGPFFTTIRFAYNDMKLRTVPQKLIAAYKIESIPLNYGHCSFDLSYIELWDNITILHRSSSDLGMTLSESLFIEDDVTHEKFYEVKGLNPEYEIDFFEALPSHVKSISIGYGSHYFIRNLDISTAKSYKYPVTQKSVKLFTKDKLQITNIYRTNDCTLVQYKANIGKYSRYAILGDNFELVDKTTNQSVSLLGRCAWLEYETLSDLEAYTKSTETGILIFPLLPNETTIIDLIDRDFHDLFFAKNVNVTLPVENTNFAIHETSPTPSQKQLSDVDISIPSTKTNNETTFAIIIANENYEEETQVEYALNDGEIFKTYCKEVLGLPESNIHYRENATLNNLLAELDWMKQISTAFGDEAKFIFYYAGHGIPDEASGDAYLLPVDGRGNMLATGYSLNKLYETLGGLTAKSITVFMDACFSGAVRDGGMMASARGVAIKAKQAAPKGNMIVLSAAQGDETAYPYKEKEHGLFTYYLLKKLQETKGDVTLGELSDYITSEVKKRSIIANGKLQTPIVTTSISATDWRNWTLK